MKMNRLPAQKNKPNSNPISSKAKIACQKIWPHPTSQTEDISLAFWL